MAPVPMAPVWMAAVWVGLMLVACGRPDSGDEVEIRRDPFVDRTAEVGLDYHHFNGMTGRRYLGELMSPGVAMIDFDGDGDLDLYLRQGNLMPDGTSLADAILPPPAGEPIQDQLWRLDRSADDAGFDLIRHPIEPKISDYGMGVATGDYDRDGHTDLYLTSLGDNRLLRNRGDGGFEDVTEMAAVADDRFGVAALFFDYDRDGWLDLYLGNYVNFSMATHKPCFAASSAVDYCGPLSFEPEPDRLLRNRGDGSFEDVSAASGLARKFGAGLGAVARDFDTDGWLDLYVANDGGENLLWHNRGDGAFDEIGLLAGGAVNAQGEKEGSMGVATGDFDGNGAIDLFITHLAEESSTLYLNDGSGFFNDVSGRSGLGVASRAMTGFGTGAVDYDNDGWLDLLTVNGAIRVIPEQEARGELLPLRQHDQLFRNLGDAIFEETSGLAPSLSASHEVGRAAAFGDLDGDGGVDVLVTNNAGPARLLVHQAAAGSHWLGVGFNDFHGHVDGRGSSVSVAVGGRRLLRQAASDGSYLAANDPRAHFGLGEQTDVASIDVVWPDGIRQRFLAPPVDRYLTVGRNDEVGP